MTEINKRGMYGGAGIFTFQSADGWMYVIFCGDGPDGFGSYVYRYKDGKEERIPLPYFSNSRPSADIEADGLYITLFKNDEKGVVRFRIPSFVVPGYPSNGSTGGQLPPPATEAIDTVARGNIASVQTKVDNTAATLKREADNLWNAIIADRKVVANLATRVNTMSNAGLTKEQVEAIAWQKALDAQYWSITSPDSDARKKLIELIVATAPKQTEGTVLTEAVVKAIATEVDKAISEITTKVVDALKPKV